MSCWARSSPRESSPSTNTQSMVDSPAWRVARGEVAAASSCSLDMVLTPAESTTAASGRRRDATWAAALVAACLAVFLLSPVSQVGDSSYTLLLADQLVRAGGDVGERGVHQENAARLDAEGTELRDKHYKCNIQQCPRR